MHKKINYPNIIIINFLHQNDVPCRESTQVTLVEEAKMVNFVTEKCIDQGTIYVETQNSQTNISVQKVQFF